MSAKKRLVSLVLVYAAASIKAADAGAGDGKNIREFHILCSLVELCKKTPTNLPESSLSDADVQAIEVINMSASTDEWQNQFPTTDKDTTAKNTDCTKQPKPINCHEKYDKWRAARIGLEQAVNKEIKQTPAKGIQKTAYGRRIHAQINDIAKEAQAIYSDYKAKTAPVLDGINNRLKVYFEDALYGKQARPLNGQPVDKWTASGTRNNDCKDTKAGLSLRGDLMCLCAQDQTITAHMCGNTITADGADWAAGTVGPIVSTMERQCASKAKAAVDAKYINKALADFTAVLKSHTGGTKDAVILGTPHTDGTCGGQNNKACVDYTGAVIPKEEGKQNEIKWYNELANAAKELDSYLTAIEQQSVAQTKIQKLKQEANRLFQTLKVQEPAPNTAISQLPRIDPLELKTKCEQFHNKSKECTENGCKWKGTDETAGTCDVDETKVTSQKNAAGAGEGAAGANTETKKCSDKKTEGDCKDGCKWDGKECKDSSILVNKQFALSVVSAAFAALLF